MSSDPAHDDDEPGLMAHIVALQQEATRQLESVTAEHGISLADYLVIAIIRRSPGGTCAPSTLSARLHRTTGGMSLTLDRLEAAGWLTREQDPSDRRRVILRLTPDGHELALATNRSLHLWEDRIRPGRRPAIIGALDELLGLLGAPSPSNWLREPHPGGERHTRRSSWDIQRAEGTGTWHSTPGRGGGASSGC